MGSKDPFSFFMLWMELKVEGALEGQSGGEGVTKGCRCLYSWGSSQRPDRDRIMRPS